MAEADCLVIREVIARGDVPRLFGEPLLGRQIAAVVIDPRRMHERVDVAVKVTGVAGAARRNREATPDRCPGLIKKAR